MYAVIDLETTGLQTGRHNRVVEVAVVRLDESGRKYDEWCTVVNPEHDFWPRHVHGIIAAEVRRAPRFADLAGRILELLRGHVLVAHNLPVDSRFLAAEFRNLGVTLPIGAGLCTMRLAGDYLRGAGRSLRSCGMAAGLPVDWAHSALRNAHAAADLLSFYLDAAGAPPPWSDLVDAVRDESWPSLPVTDAVSVSRRWPLVPEPHFLARLVDRLPRLNDPQGDAYLDLLDRALLSGPLSAIADAINDAIAAADALALATVDANGLNRQYLDDLVAAALADGAVTAEQRRDLDSVAMLLGLPVTAVAEAARTVRERWRLQPGDLVAFVGPMGPAQEEWQRMAIARGLRVSGHVSRKTKLLVASDPDSLPARVKTARQYGIPIVGPEVFRGMPVS